MNAPANLSRTELVVVSAENDGLLAGEISRLVGFIDRVPEVPLPDLAYTCSLSSGKSVLAVVAADVDSLRARLVSARSRIENGQTARVCDKSGTYFFRKHLLGEGEGKLAFVYPGVMGFYPDMLRDIAVEFPECRAAFDELEEAMAKNDDFTPSNFIFPPAPYYSRDADIFKSGAYAQALVATFAASSALTRLFARLGMEPDGVLGCAGGDLAAMMRSGAAGEMSRPDRVRAIGEIYALVDRAVGHAGLPAASMYSVLLRRDGEIDAALEGFPPGKVSVAIDFSPRQKTISVEPGFEKEATAALEAAGARLVKLDLDRPFNTMKCAAIVPAVKKFVSSWVRHDAVCDVYSCASASKVPPRPRHVRNDLADRWAKPIRLADTVRAMRDDGYRVFLEVGPGGMIASAVDDTLKGTGDCAAIAANSSRRRGLLALQHAVAQLAALGARLDLSAAYAGRKVRKIDFDSAISLEVRKDSEMKLSRSFPRLTLLGEDGVPMDGASFLAEPQGRGAKAAQRAAAVAAQMRRQRRFDFGAAQPMVSDADVIEKNLGAVEITKTFRFADAPFLADFALGNSQLSYSDPNLKGLVLLAVPVGAEIMAEVANMVVPNQQLTAVEDLSCRRMVAFSSGALKLYVRAERVASGAAGVAAVKVQLRDDSPDAAYTWPVMEGLFLFSPRRAGCVPVDVQPLAKPRNVHWSGREIYPARLCSGRRLRGITFADAWSESGLDYVVAVPSSASAFSFTRFPIWQIDPLLLESAVGGFALWRSHEKFAGAFSFPFRVRRIEFRGATPPEGASLKCYMRLTGVTPKSHICDISVTDGNGGVLISVSGWEELTERVPEEYRNMVLQPATTFITEPLPPEMMGKPSTDVASAFITDVPYPIFERNEELWLKTMSHIVLNAQERDEMKAKLSGSASRRTEWLFGRIAAKEAVRRFLKDFCQARWSDADVGIWADDSGKPHPIGEWNDYLTTRLDIAIAHTSQFVVAVAAANAKVGVDVESVARDLSGEFCDGVFSPEEQALAKTSSSPSLALIRFWCAKEAVSKALGTGIRYPPKEMRICSFDPSGGSIAVRLDGAWLAAFKSLKGREISVASRIIRDHALAFCFLSASLFNDG